MEALKILQDAFSENYQTSFSETKELLKIQIGIHLCECFPEAKP